MRKNSHRMTRVNEEVKMELSAIIQREVKDPRIDSLVSVVAVDTTGDLKECKVYISVLGDEEKRAQTMEGLKSSAGFIRRELAHRLNLRNTPNLHFMLDTSIERGVEMSRLIRDVRLEDELHSTGEE
ncbi:30S ribosome-binding factor RbfA [Lachnospiraceae bacterium oral taxon 500]|nr:30S ribosome-binding factor RbfA [Lachnospiraceae bacterium oral taxon 500]